MLDGDNISDTNERLSSSKPYVEVANLLKRTKTFFDRMHQETVISDEM